MSIEQLEKQIEALPREELARFVAWFDVYLGRTSETETDPECDLSDQEKAELIRRRDELLANPELAEPMDEEYFANLKRELTDERARKASGC